MANQATKRLTPEQTRTLYHPLTYAVKRVNESVYSLKHEYTGLQFYVKRTGTIWRVTSILRSGGLGNCWEVNSRHECNCPDSYRAHNQNRYCKHQAVIVAVVDFIRRE